MFPGHMKPPPRSMVISKSSHNCCNRLRVISQSSNSHLTIISQSSHIHIRIISRWAAIFEPSHINFRIISWWAQNHLIVSWHISTSFHCELTFISQSSYNHLRIISWWAQNQLMVNWCRDADFKWRTWMVPIWLKNTSIYK